MKKDLHPENYRPVAFKDMSNDEVFITKSTANAKETIEIDGETYPLIDLDSLLSVGSTLRDEDFVVGHIFECHWTVILRM